MIPPRILEILHLNYFGYLCTLDETLTPHITPIFFVYDHRNKMIYSLSDKKSKKVRNIERNPEVSLTVDMRDEDDPFSNEGILVRGNAMIFSIEESRVDMLPEILEIYEVFKNKYRKFTVVSETSDVMIRFEIHRITHWIGPKFTSIKVRG